MPRPPVPEEVRKARKAAYKKRWREENPIKYSIQIERANDVRRFRKLMTDTGLDALEKRLRSVGNRDTAGDLMMKAADVIAVLRRQKGEIKK